MAATAKQTTNTRKPVRKSSVTPSVRKTNASAFTTYFEIGRETGEGGKVKALRRFHVDVADGTLEAKSAKGAAQAYADGQASATGNALKATSVDAMSKAFEAVAAPRVVEHSTDFLREMSKALESGRYTKAKTGKDFFTSYYKAARAFAKDESAEMNPKFLDDQLKRGDSNRAKAKPLSKAEKARKAIETAIKALTPKAGFDKADQATINKVYALLKITPKVV